MGDYAAAEPLFRQALEICRTALGEDHPDYASSLSNLAGCTGRWGTTRRPSRSTARPWRSAGRRWARATRDYAASLNNLARLYQAMGDHAAAEPLYRQALEIRRTALGEDHPDYAAGLNNLAACTGPWATMPPLYPSTARPW